MRPGFVVGQNADGRLEIFGVEAFGAPTGVGNLANQERNFWTFSQQTAGGNWSHPVKLGKIPGDSELMVGSTADGRIQIFAVSNEGDALSNWQVSASSNSWAGFTDFGAQ